MPRLWSVTAVALVMVVAAACTAGDLGQPSSTTTTSRESELPPPPPEVGQCRGLISKEIILASTDDRRPVPCDQPHGSETVLVVELPPEVAELSHREAMALASDAPVLRSVLELCDVAFEDYIGVNRITPDSVIEGNLGRAFYMPTSEDWARGARWLRCDAVTTPLNGDSTRETTERLRGVLDRDPLPPEWRSCYRDVSIEPRLTFATLVSCDQPHSAEVLLRFQVTDPKLEAIVNDRATIDTYNRTTLPESCINRVAVLVGLSTDALRRREDMKVSSVPLGVDSWAANPAARRVQCLVYTTERTVGTVEDLADRPLPRP